MPFVNLQVKHKEFKLDNIIFSHVDYWITRDGILWKISEMTDSHLANTIAYIKKKFGLLSKDAIVIEAVPQYKTMLEEQIHRESIKINSITPVFLESRDW